MNNKIKFAVIGCGHIGLRHATIINKHPEAELSALCDTLSPEKQKLQNLQATPFYNDLELLLGDKEVDVVNICTPNGIHTSQALLALRHKKHIVIEKPMGLSAEACMEVIKKAREVSRHVFCVMQNRYSPPSIWLKEITEKNLLGKIYFVQINCFWNRDGRYYKKGCWKGSKELDGGTLFTQFSHFIDMMIWLFGDIKNVRSKFNNFSHTGITEFEDSGIVTFDFIKEGMGSINFSTSVYDINLESSITILGEKGSVKVAGQYMNKVEYCHIHDYIMPELPASNPPNDYGSYKGSAANHHYIIENVINTLKGNSQASTSGTEGMKVVEVIERIYKSS